MSTPYTAAAQSLAKQLQEKRITEVQFDERLGKLINKAWIDAWEQAINDGMVDAEAEVAANKVANDFIQNNF